MPLACHWISASPSPSLARLTSGALLSPCTLFVGACPKNCSRSAAVAESCPLTPHNVALSMLPASGEIKLQCPAWLLPPLSFSTLQPLTCPFSVFFLWCHISSPGDLISLYSRPSRLRGLVASQRYPVHAPCPQCCKQNPYQQRKIKQIALH